jgi:hypothetical protein
MAWRSLSFGSGRRSGAGAIAARATVVISVVATLIPHHEGAIAMAELALQRSRRAEIWALAESIRTLQSAEIAPMSRWLAQGVDAPQPLPENVWPFLQTAMAPGITVTSNPDAAHLQNLGVTRCPIWDPETCLLLLQLA